MRNGTDVVVAFGGDGTVNEVVTGLLTDGVARPGPGLGIVPAGSTNVFARALGLPNDPIEATGVLLEALRTGSQRSVSLGVVDDRCFIFSAGMGFDAAIVGRRRAPPAPRQAFDPRARMHEWGFREFFPSDRRHPKLHLELPDGTDSMTSTS